MSPTKRPKGKTEEKSHTKRHYTASKKGLLQRTKRQKIRPRDFRENKQTYDTGTGAEFHVQFTLNTCES